MQAECFFLEENWIHITLPQKLFLLYYHAVAFAGGKSKCQQKLHTKIIFLCMEEDIFSLRRQRDRAKGWSKRFGWKNNEPKEIKKKKSSLICVSALGNGTESFLTMET